MNSNSTNVTTTTTKAPRIALSKKQVAEVLGFSRSELLIKYGYITEEVLKAGKFENIEAYKRRHVLGIPEIEAIFKQLNATWEEAYAKLNL